MNKSARSRARMLMFSASVVTIIERPRPLRREFPGTLLRRIGFAIRNLSSSTELPVPRSRSYRWPVAFEVLFEWAYPALTLLLELAYLASAVTFLRWLHLAFRRANAMAIDVGATPGRRGGLIRQPGQTVHGGAHPARRTRGRGGGEESPHGCLVDPVDRRQPLQALGGARHRSARGDPERCRRDALRWDSPRRGRSTSGAALRPRSGPFSRNARNTSDYACRCWVHPSVLAVCGWLVLEKADVGPHVPSSSRDHPLDGWPGRPGRL